MATPRDGISTSDKIRYQVDRFLSWGAAGRFLGLFVISFVLIVICALLSMLVNDENPDFFEAMWWAMTRVADAGTMGDDKGTLLRMVATMSTLSGVLVVALLIGLTSSTVSDKLDDLRKGKSPVIDSGHTLILGFSEKVFTILRELREANSNLKDASVVILSFADKEEVENAVRDRMGDMLSTRVVVRQGSPFAPNDLRKVGAARAKSIIVLAADTGEEGEEADADLGAIKCLLALRRISGALANNHCVVELRDADRRGVVEQLGAGGVEVVAMEDTLSRVMVQTARQNGLAQVYRDLLTFEGSEFYFKRFAELDGRPFGEAQWKMADAVVVGYRRPGQNGEPAQTVLNPKDDVLLEAGDELLVVAEDDDSFRLGASHAPQVPEGFRGVTSSKRHPERLLILGTSPKLPGMLREYEQYVQPGSEAALMPGISKDAFTASLQGNVGQLSKLKLKYLEGDPTSPDDLKKAATADLNCVLVVADTEKATDEADARTVMAVLLLRDLFKSYGDKAPRIISEILDPRTKDLLEQDSGSDFVVSSEMTSMLLAQVSERRELNAVFADLFDSDGNEVYLKRAACFAPLGTTVSWLSVQLMARRRGEVAIGYYRPGHSPVLNPKQNEGLVFTEDDRVIAIAEDDREAVDTVLAPEEPTNPEVTAIPAPGPAPSSLLPQPPAQGRAPPIRTTSGGGRVQGPST
ncbi:MAG: NAD-binding protein, partial [Myxococcaceae bacterium]|nr:NAD-binding protein [Myxococcaceae bacterium]